MENRVIVTGQDIKKEFGNYPLLRLAIAVTSGCNLKCVHCSQDSGEITKKEMSREEIFKLIDDGKRLGLITLPITGGEPFVREDILEILKYANNKNVGIILNTNATLISKKQANEIKKLKNIVLVAVSLDGLKKTHDEIRKSKGSYEKALKGIKKLVSRNLNITLAFTIMQKNINEIGKVVGLALKLKLPLVRFLFMEEFGRGKQNKKLVIEYKGRQRIIKKIARIAKRLKRKLTIWVYAPPALVPDFLRKSMPYTSGCLPGVTICDIQSDGTIYPCFGLQGFPELKIGNIHNKKIKEIWEKSKTLNKLRKLKPENLEGVCKKCLFVKSCMGHCRAAAYCFVDQTFTAPNPWCQEYYKLGLFPKKHIVS